MLIVLLDYGATADGTPAPATAAAGGDPEYDRPAAAARATARQLLANVGANGSAVESRPFPGIARLLNNVHEARVPRSVMEIEYQEVLLLWKFLEENEGFMAHVLKHCDVSQLVVPICTLFEARKDVPRPARAPAPSSSSSSAASATLRAAEPPYTAQLPCDLPLFTGTHTDLLVVVLHKMVVNGSDKLSPLYNCFLTIICNVSPYTKTLCLLSSVKLVNLFELFTSHRFLYAAEGNHVYVALLLEIFNNVIQYRTG